MSYTNDPMNSVIDRIRLKVGDTDEVDEGLSDEVYEYLYESQGKNENRAALEALKMLVFKYARYITEKAGGLYVKESEIYDHYKELLDRATKDPSFSFLLAGVAFAGGINRQERLLTGSSNPFSLGEGRRAMSRVFNTLNPLWDRHSNLR
jgi:hypothetical protein